MNSFARLKLVVVWIAASPVLSATDVQFLRIRADAPTTITGFNREGEIAWTSPQANVRWTVETTPGDAERWGAVASGLQAGTEHKVKVDLTSYPANTLSVRATYSTSPLAGMEMILQDEAWQEIARAITNARGECWFHHVPPGAYWVSNIETALYAQNWFSSLPGAPQRFEVRVQRHVPLGMAPEGEASAPLRFAWGTLTDCAFYNFKLYSNNTNTHELKLLEEVPDLVDNSYASLQSFTKNWHYLWTVTGYDIWNNPVMLGTRNFSPLFTGDGGGKTRTNRIFGVVRFSTVPMGNFTLQLQNFNTLQVVAQTVTDERGWYVFANVPAGVYSLGHQDANHAGSVLTRIEVPATFPHQGTFELVKRSTLNVPGDHQRISVRTPTFEWSGLPQSVTYSFSLVRSSPFLAIHEQHGLTTTSYTPPITLADSDSYFWSVEGKDASGNPVLQAGAGFAVKGP